MKHMKKLILSLVVMCLMVLGMSTTSFAANGVVYYSDLETSVGQYFTITGTIKARSGELGAVSVQMAYDPAYMNFIDGEGVESDGAGNLTFTGNGNGSTSEIQFSMNFQALAEGTTRMSQGSTSLLDGSGKEISYDEGYADVVIGPGDPSLIQPAASVATSEVTVGGVSYVLSSNFDAATIPKGYTETELTYQDNTYRAISYNGTDVKAGYLIDPEQKGKFFIYSEKSNAFYPIEEVMISDEYSILLLDGRGEVELPKEYVEATMVVNGFEFPIWNAPDREGFFVLYAINNQGQKSLYIYDSVEHTYQRMETPQSAVVPDSQQTKETKWSKFSDFVSKYLIWIVVGVGCIITILFVLFLSKAFKLLLRDREIDKLYDRLEAYEGGHKGDSLVKKNSPKTSNKSYNDDDDYDDDDDDHYDDDDFDDFDDDDHVEAYDDDFDDYYDDDDFDDDDNNDSDFDYDDYYDDDDDEIGMEDDDEDDDDDYDDFYDEDYEKENIVKKMGKKNRRSDVSGDTFEIDFVDID